MSSAWLYAIPSVIVVSLLSLVGLAVIAVPKAKLDKALLFIVAVAIGSLLGDAFIELLPESYSQLNARAGPLTLLGILLFLLLERGLRHRHEHATLPEKTGYHPVGYMNLLADSIHNFTDGLIIGVSYLADVRIGMATTLAVIFHEIPHEMGNFFVLLYAGFSKSRALLLNGLTGLVAILGTVLALLIGSELKSFARAILPVAAGGFIYIAASDLIPELNREPDARRSVLQWFAIVFGICLILLLNAFA